METLFYYDFAFGNQPEHPTVWKNVKLRLPAPSYQVALTMLPYLGYNMSDVMKVYEYYITRWAGKTQVTYKLRDVYRRFYTSEKLPLEANILFKGELNTK